MYICNLMANKRRTLSECGFTITNEGIYHPDRIMHEFDILYMIEGTWDLYVGAELLHISAGDLVLMPPGIRHYSTEKSSDGMKNMYIHFGMQEGDLEDTASSEAFRLSIPILLHCQNKDSIPEAFREIINIYYSCKSDIREYLLSTHLDALLGKLAAHAEAVIRDGIRTSPVIGEIVKFLTDNPDCFYSQTELAEMFGMSIRSLTSQFKAVTGQPLHVWQTEYKLTAIHDILKYTPDRKLHDLAISYGFYDEFQLSRLYKRKYGISPKKFRTVKT